MSSLTATGATPATGALRPVGARTQILGLALAGLGAGVMLVIGLATGAPLDEASFLMIPLALAAVAVGLAWRFGTWARVLGVVISLLVGLALFWTAFGLAAIDSPADFVPGVMVPMGTVLGLVGGVRSLVGRRPVASEPSPTESRTRTIAAAVVLLAVIIASAANLLTRDSVAAAAASGATPVSMGSFVFEPATFTVAAGEDAQLLVTNDDAFLHDLALPEQDLAVTVSPGSEALLDVSSLAPGAYTVYCTLHSDTGDPDADTAGMAGTLVVE